MEINDWSFNAPQYVDFTIPQPEDDEADKWFDVNDDGKPIDDFFNEDGAKENIDDEPSSPKFPKEQIAETVTKKAVPEIKKAFANVLTPSRWYKNKSANNEKTSGNVKKFLKPEHTGPRQSPRLNKPMKALPIKTSQSASEEIVNKLTKVSSMSNLNRHSDAIEGKKTLKKAISSSKLKRTSSLKLNSVPDVPGRVLRNRGLSAERPEQLKKDSVSNDQSSQKDAKMTVTIPTTPTCMKRKQTSMGPARVIKTSEERELEAIETFRKTLAERRKQSDLSLKKQKAAGGIGPMKVPNEADDTTESKPESRTKKFLESIKDKFTSSSSKVEKAQRKNSDSEKQSQKFESMAERVLSFQHGTPDRFHSRPNERCKGLKRLRSKSPRNSKLTIPHTPNLQSKSRTRSVHAPSREEIEEKMVEDMQKNQFHAQPMNHKIFEHTTGLKEVAKKPSTKAKAFELSSDKRMKEREPKKSSDDERVSFHAKPVNPKILEGVVGVKPIKEIPTTVPHSPAFALKNRVRLPVTSPEEKEAFRVLRSRPVPHNGVPFNPKLSHKYTIPQPFSFEEQMHQMQDRQEAKRRKIFKEERKAREFHAQPMRYLFDEPIGVPPKQTKDITEPVPFEFDVDFRSFRKADETASRLEDDTPAPFKAKPVTVIYQEPFIPKKSTKPLTDVSEFELNTEKRAVKRESFEMYLKHKEAQMAASKRQKEEDAIAAAKAEEALLRMESVHKANPVRHYAPVQINPSDKPLTNPESPMFTDRYKV